MHLRISVYQIIIILFAVYFIGDRFLRFARRERTQSIFKLLTVVVIWTGIAMVGIFGLGEHASLIIFIGFILVFLILLRMLAIIEKIEHTITEIIRREALRDIKEHE